MNPEFDAEIKIRGRFMMMSADMEYTLLNICAYSAPDPYNQTKKFYKKTMGDKINFVKADLKKYKRKYYKEYKAELKELNTFREVRNDMAHNKMDFHIPGDLSQFRMVFVDDWKGYDRMAYRLYTLLQVDDFLNQFQNLNMRLGKLWKQLKDDYDNSLLAGDN